MPKFLQSVNERFGSLPLPLEHLGNMRSMSIKEVFGSLKVQELKLQERDSGIQLSQDIGSRSSSRGKGQAVNKGR